MGRQAHAQKSEEEIEEKRRRARDKEFQKRDFNVGESSIKVEAPKSETRKSDSPKQVTEASLKTTVQEKDIVIDDRGTLSKDYSAKETLTVGQTEQYLEQKRREEKKFAEQKVLAEPKEAKREKEREKEIHEKVSGKESAKAREQIDENKRKLDARERSVAEERIERVRKQRKEAAEHIERQLKEGPKRTREIAEMKKLADEKKKSIKKEVEALQRILLSPFGKKRGKRGAGIIKSIDGMIVALKGLAKKKTGKEKDL